MNRLLVAAAMGAVAGSRTMLAPALVARARHAPLAGPLALAAAGELMADKLPFMPARTTTLPLLGRAFSGAAVGAALTPHRRAAGAVAGALGALAAAYVLTGTRLACEERRVPNAFAGLCEDAAALAVGLWAVERAIDRGPLT